MTSVAEIGLAGLRRRLFARDPLHPQASAAEVADEIANLINPAAGLANVLMERLAYAGLPDSEATLTDFFFMSDLSARVQEQELRGVIGYLIQHKGAPINAPNSLIGGLAERANVIASYRRELKVLRATSPGGSAARMGLVLDQFNATEKGLERINTPDDLLSGLGRAAAFDMLRCWADPAAQACARQLDWSLQDADPFAAGFSPIRFRSVHQLGAELACVSRSHRLIYCDALLRVINTHLLGWDLVHASAMQLPVRSPLRPFGSSELVFADTSDGPA
jgi:hypothetical protein